MSQTKVDQLISEAEKFLSHHVYDIAHDLEHHHQVWANVQKIVENINEKVDLAALQIAAMWHDVTTQTRKVSKKRAKKTTAEYVAQKMADLGFHQSTINRTKTAILEHSVMNKQSILESKILADADLLEWFSVERFKKLLTVYTTGKLKIIKRTAFKYFAQKWLERIPALIHFEITKKIITYKIRNFKRNHDIRQLIKDQGEKIDSYFKMFD